ncbi:YcaO-like family protein [Polyangium sorediatum]|uniref:YcaO-like family protein n=1 Tax=Polyangium sorediatum TaxID=889274 RepID=A0ABT6P3F2_9BACT|nr:YcaO-like family protein [Polyangium sorediatum]MDI1434882.1 YcaO-like family protein [Polyangium sorediatum]
MSTTPAAKRFRRGTHRIVPPEATLARVQGLLPIMGITRIADVTGLDTIGIPVAMAIRPNARSLSVSQGKGADRASARASALMESVEQYHAEHIDRPLRLATRNELRFSHRVADLSGLPRLAGSVFHDNLRTLWIEGQEMLHGGSMWVPYEMVHMDYTLPLPSGSGSFLMSSNGLASGNHPLEALGHALAELIERDATALFQLAGEAQKEARVDLSTVHDPLCRSLLDKYEEAGVEVAVWEVTSDIGVPVFSCVIVDREPNPQRPIGPMGGMGCHPSRAVALSRALTEAAQSRLTLITGSRDDVHCHERPEGGDLDAARRALRMLAASPPARSFEAAPDHEDETLDDDVAWLLERLAAAGLSQVITIDLTKAAFGIPVVRVIVPGLEANHDVPGYVPGLRARRRMEGRTR